jgi:hypothetical protein
MAILTVAPERRLRAAAGLVLDCGVGAQIRQFCASGFRTRSASRVLALIVCRSAESVDAAELFGRSVTSVVRSGDVVMVTGNSNAGTLNVSDHCASEPGGRTRRLAGGALGRG